MNAIELAWEYLDKVAAARGSKEKKFLLKEACDDSNVGSILSEFFRYSIDPFIHFGVDIDSGLDKYKKKTLADSAAAKWWASWLEFMDRLARRDYTGNVARRMAYDLLEEAGFAIARWAVPMFRRDYSIGVGSSLVEAIWPGMINWFEIQLCSTWDGISVPENATVEPKFDGLRAIFIMDKDPICLSRNGKELFNVGHIIDDLSGLKGYVVDGELFNKDWATSVSAARSSERGDRTSRLRAFDCIPIKEFKEQKCSLTLEARRKVLSTRVNSCAFVKFDAGVKVKTMAEVVVATKKFIKDGFEGGVLKDLDSTYGYTRDSSWCKIKEFDTADVKIIDFEEGNGKNEGKLGAFVVEGDGISECRVGGGFTDEQRKEFWDNKDKYLMKTIEVQYQGISDDKKFRFPVFIRLRSDKD